MIQARFIVEAQGKPKSLVETSLKKHIENLKNMEDVELLDEKWEPTETVDTFFSSLVDIGIKAPDFEVFFAALMSAAPTAVVVEDIDKVEIDVRQLQNVTNDLVQLFHAFAQANAQLRMDNEKIKQITGLQDDSGMDVSREKK